MQRFWEKVDIPDKDSCWIWTGFCPRYGRFSFEGKSVAAHRFSYELCKGKIPDGMAVLHSCDNTKCVNPAHLRLGTQKDNAKDRSDRNRVARHKGESNGNSTLSFVDVANIRKEPSSLTHVRLSKKYGVTPEMISLIRRNLAWKEQV